ncbi:MAG TPA: hypothetical protein VI653_09495 [Steroidobacteraceae bacterium]
MINYDAMSKAELRNACKAAGIKYSNMTNETMREALTKADAERVHAADRPSEPAVAVVTEQPTIIAPTTESSPAVDALENDFSNFVESLPATSAEPAVTTPASEKPKAAPAPKAEQRNGVSKPTRGLTLDVWNACDSLKAEGKELTFEALKEKLPNHNAATIRTQRQRHKTYHAEK